MGINELIDQLDLVTLELRQCASCLGIDKVHQRPSLESWSFAEIVDHLVQATASYRPFFEAIERGTHRTPLAGWLPGYAGFMGKLLKDSVQPNASRKLKTFPVWEPQVEVKNQSLSILESFDASQIELKSWILTTPSAHWNKILRSPASPVVVYTVGAAFEVLVLHQLRHLDQAKRLC
jgi:hypothetical protein